MVQINNPFTDWIEKQARGGVGAAVDTLPGMLPSPPNPLDFLPSPNIGMPQVGITTPFSPDSLIRELPRIALGTQKGTEQPAQKRKVPKGSNVRQQQEPAEEPELMEGSSRASRSPEVAWIDTLDNKTYKQGGKSATAAAGVVLQNSGIKVSDQVAKEFRKGAGEVINGYNETAHPQHRNIHNYYEVLTNYLMQLSNAEAGIDPNTGQAPVDMSGYQGWNPNSGQQFESAQPGQNPITNRVNQIQAVGSREEADAQESQRMGLAQLMNIVNPVGAAPSLGIHIGNMLGR